MRTRETTPEELFFRIERWARVFHKDGIVEFIARFGEVAEEDVLGAFRETVGDGKRVFELLEELEREKRLVCEFKYKQDSVKPVWRLRNED